MIKKKSYSAMIERALVMGRERPVEILVSFLPDIFQKFAALLPFCTGCDLLRKNFKFGFFVLNFQKNYFKNVNFTWISGSIVASTHLKASKALNTIELSETYHF